LNLKLRFNSEYSLDLLFMLGSLINCIKGVIMDITFKKKKDDLVGDVIAKSNDLEHGVEDFEAEIENCSLGQKFITVSPRMCEMQPMCRRMSS